MNWYKQSEIGHRLRSRFRRIVDDYVSDGVAIWTKDNDVFVKINDGAESKDEVLYEIKRVISGKVTCGHDAPSGLGWIEV